MECLSPIAIEDEKKGKMTSGAWGFCFDINRKPAKVRKTDIGPAGQRRNEILLV